MSAHLENSATATGLERVIFVPVWKKGNAKGCSNYHTAAFISQASKVMLKIFKIGFNSKWTENTQMNKLDLGKAEPKVKFQHLLHHRKSKEIPEKYLSHWLC